MAESQLGSGQGMIVPHYVLYNLCYREITRLRRIGRQDSGPI